VRILFGLQQADEVVGLIERAVQVLGLEGRGAECQALLLRARYPTDSVPLLGVPEGMLLTPGGEGDEERALAQGSEALRRIGFEQVRTCCSEWPADEALPEAAMGWRADVLVVGRHRRSALARFLVPGTLVGAATRCGCPVVVIPVGG
jgi:nucleotide-binding universal stress UspA family protein